MKKVKVKMSKPKISVMKFSEFFVKLGSHTLSQFFVFIIILLIINIFSQKLFLRLDITENKTYTLSQGTKNIIGDLDETVTIESYFSKDLPPDLLSVIRDVHDIYAEYERFSNGKIDHKIIDNQDESFKTKAQEAGIPEIQYGQRSEDKSVIALGFLGAQITYKENSEIIEIIDRVENLEYETTSRIFELTTEEKPKIGFLAGHGEKSAFVNYKEVNNTLERQFTIESIDLSDGKPIDPNEIAVLIVAGPKEKLTNRDRFELDQYIMRGGKLVVLSELYDLAEQEPIVTKNESNISNFLKHYGVEVTESVVLDESYTPLILELQIYAYPFWPLIQPENINKDIPVYSTIEAITLFWPQQITETEGDTTAKISPILETTEKGWELGGDTVNVHPSSISVPGFQHQRTLGALIEGKLTSAFKDKDIPKLGKDVDDKRKKKDPRVDETENALIIVIGDSDFISDNFLQIGSAEQNLIFFNNTIEWLANSEELISIRSKNIQTRPLKITEQGERTFIKTVNIASVPVAMVAIGIFYNLRRRKRNSII